MPGVTNDPYTTRRVATYDPKAEYLVLIMDKSGSSLTSQPITPGGGANSPAELFPSLVGMASRLWAEKGPGLLVAQVRDDTIASNYAPLSDLRGHDAATVPRWIAVVEEAILRRGTMVPIYIAYPDEQRGHMMADIVQPLDRWHGIDVTPRTIDRRPFTPKRAEGWGKAFVGNVYDHAADWWRLYGPGVIALRGAPRVPPAMSYILREAIPDVKVYQDVTTAYDGQHMAPFCWLYPDGTVKLDWLDLSSPRG